MPFKFLRHLSKPSDKPGDPSVSSDPTARAKAKIGIGALVEQSYRLEAELGRGGMGIVYRAHDVPHDRQVAFKVLNLDAAGPGALSLFLQEANITSRLEHPNIVAVYETGTVDTGGSRPSPFIAMEFVQGKSLSEMRGLTFARIVDIGRQICNALEYTHALGLVHGDLKPENVLVEKRGYQCIAKLADFGVARPRGASILTMPGTAYYMAPEVIGGQPADVAADLYALGVMLYELVTGRVPFSNFDEQSILSQHLTDTVVPPSQSRPEIPVALEAIILRLLAKDPHDRYASAGDVRDALEKVTISLRPKGTRTNLPQSSMSLAGHEDEITRVKELLETSRVVSLLGTPGNGKTQLALQVGRQLVEQFADGVWLVELEPWADPSLVPQAIASVFGVREESHRRLAVSLAEYLREKNLLLILDQCNALTGACANVAASLLNACPEVSILATSDRLMNISGETRYDVPPGLDRIPVGPDQSGAPSKVRTEGEGEQRKHRDTYLSLALETAPHLNTDRENEWSARLEAAYPDLIAALDWTLGRPQDTTLAWQFGSALWRFWYCRTRWREGAERLTKIMALPHTAADAPARVQCIIGAGYLAILQADYAVAQERLESGLALARELKDDVSIAYALSGLGSLWHARGDLVQAGPYYRDGAEHWKALGNLREMAHTLLDLGAIHMLRSDTASAQAVLQDALQAYRQLDDKHRTANTLDRLGLIAYQDGDYERARTFLDESLVISRELDDKSGTAGELDHLGYVALRQGKVEPARRCFAESLAIYEQMNERRRMAEVVTGIAGVLASQGEYASAAELIGAGDTLADTPPRPPATWRDAPIDIPGRVERDKAWVTSCIQMDAGTFQAARERGRLMGIRLVLKPPLVVMTKSTFK